MENCLELLSVTTLRHRLDTAGPLSLGEASVIVDQIAVILDGLHVHGNVHGSLIPENVLLLPGNQVQLLAQKSASQASTSACCSGRAFAGSAHYLSPEEVRGESLTPATDIWCLGALLHEMLTGFPPFVALRLNMLRDLVSHHEPDLLPRKTASAQFVLDRALAKWPANRFVSAQEMANLLWTAAPAPHVPAGGSAAVTSPATARPISSVSTAVSLQQAVNRPLTLTSGTRPSDQSQSGSRRWLRFFGIRKHSGASADAVA